jgi:predicted dehydrogenase
MSNERRITRRGFLGGTAATVALPYIIPRTVWGANERIVTAVIGTGGMGRNHIAPDCAALCDVDDKMLAEGVKRVSTGTPFTAKDYRRILERKDIDAVYIGTPDHWHALMTVDACEAGKHVYCEKPACRSVAEGRAMIDAARKHKRVVQIGSQGRSNTVAHKACEYVRNGQIGKVSRVEIWHENNWETDRKPEPTAPPPNLDWQMWLGPARDRPYHDLIHPFHFRWYMDFGGGFVRDRGAHALSIMNWLLENDGYKGVVTVEATGRPQVKGIYNVPLGMDVKWVFKDRDLTVTWTQPGQPKLGSSWGATYIGDKDTLIVAQGDGGCNTEDKAKSYQVPSGGKQVYLHPFPSADATARHRQNFLDCIKTGERPAVDVEIGVRVVTLGNLANLAYTLGRPLAFDFGRERFAGEGARELNQKHLSEPYRDPWKL